jgi:hypothetical protein
MDSHGCTILSYFSGRIPDPIAFFLLPDILFHFFAFYDKRKMGQKIRT